MIVTEIQIAQMSREEKIQLMEALWADLSRTDMEVESPEWHREALEEAEARQASGQDSVVDWSDAKQALRRRVE